MALKIELKPHERFILGGAVVTNGASRTEITVENNVPILRGKNIMALEEADTPCKRIYFVIQLMYVDGANLKKHHRTYWQLVQEIVGAAPSMTGLLDKVSDHLLKNLYYQALREARKLIEHEERLVGDVRKSIAGIPEHPQNGHDGPAC